MVPLQLDRKVLQLDREVLVQDLTPKHFAEEGSDLLVRLGSAALGWEARTSKPMPSVSEHVPFFPRFSADGAAIS